MSGGRWSHAYEERHRLAREREGVSPFAEAAAALAAAGADERTAVVHCWVRTPRDGTRPGVLMAWRRDGERWLGRVAYVLLDRAGRPVLVDGWVPAAVLSPAGPR
ncbi:hypothetical protein [Kineococcus indalonis]|uniref:hypothetical protein n=1 Tax=Kineococcus indalonis TaxID=2696566 RepID=UPI001412ED44|nr:hypothetical protein [Kineococcus indalonis]NAZ86870.1 hypothetical protein [Kineococcus indalonis]